MQFVSMSFTLGSQYEINSNSLAMPLTSVRVGKGTFASTANWTHGTSCLACVHSLLRTPPSPTLCTPCPSRPSSAEANRKRTSASSPVATPPPPSEQRAIPPQTMRSGTTTRRERTLRRRSLRTVRQTRKCATTPGPSRRQPRRPDPACRVRSVQLFYETPFVCATDSSGRTKGISCTWARQVRHAL